MSSQGPRTAKTSQLKKHRDPLNITLRKEYHDVVIRQYKDFLNHKKNDFFLIPDF